MEIEPGFEQVYHCVNVMVGMLASSVPVRSN